MVWLKSEIDSLEATFANGKYYERIKNNKEYWGIFQIDGKKITTQKWFESSGGPLWALTSSGEILNDTTFRLTESVRIDGTERRAIDVTYHFRAFSPKPDSTCPFIQ